MVTGVDNFIFFLYYITWLFFDHPFHLEKWVFIIHISYIIFKLFFLKFYATFGENKNNIYQ